MATGRVELGPATYDVVIDGTPSTVTVPTLTSGSIDQGSPTEGDTLTVSGSNASATATYQWQKGGVDIGGATSASLDTTGEGTGDFRRGVSDGTQGPTYTATATVGAAAGVSPNYLNSYEQFTNSAGIDSANLTTAIPSAGQYIVAITDQSNNGVTLSVGVGSGTVTSLGNVREGTNLRTAHFSFVEASGATSLTTIASGGTSFQRSIHVWEATGGTATGAVVQTDTQAAATSATASITGAEATSGLFAAMMQASADSSIAPVWTGDVTADADTPHGGSAGSAVASADLSATGDVSATVTLPTAESIALMVVEIKEA